MFAGLVVLGLIILACYVFARIYDVLTAAKRYERKSKQMDIEKEQLMIRLTKAEELNKIAMKSIHSPTVSEKLLKKFESLYYVLRLEKAFTEYRRTKLKRDVEDEEKDLQMVIDLIKRGNLSQKDIEYLEGIELSIKIKREEDKFLYNKHLQNNN